MFLSPAHRNGRGLGQYFLILWKTIGINYQANINLKGPQLEALQLKMWSTNSRQIMGFYCYSQLREAGFHSCEGKHEGCWGSQSRAALRLSGSRFGASSLHLPWARDSEE